MIVAFDNVLHTICECITANVDRSAATRANVAKTLARRETKGGCTITCCAACDSVGQSVVCRVSHGGFPKLVPSLSACSAVMGCVRDVCNGCGSGCAAIGCAVVTAIGYEYGTDWGCVNVEHASEWAEVGM